MIRINKTFRHHLIAAAMIAVIISLVFGSLTCAKADKASIAKDSQLPAGLFLKAPPANAVGVNEARRTAAEGKPVVMRGRIGGTAKPIAEKYAMFLVTDVSIGLCKDGCADFCQVPREQLMSNMATVQVVDNSGRPLKVPIEGIDGLKPLVQVVVKGTVAKRDNNFLVVNAHNIFVERNAK